MDLDSLPDGMIKSLLEQDFFQDTVNNNPFCRFLLEVQVDNLRDFAERLESRSKYWCELFRQWRTLHRLGLSTTEGEAVMRCHKQVAGIIGHVVWFRWVVRSHRMYPEHGLEKLETWATDYLKRLYADLKDPSV